MGSTRAKAEDCGGEKETFAASLQEHTPSQPLKGLLFLAWAEMGILLMMYLNEIFKTSYEKGRWYFAIRVFALSFSFCMENFQSY